MKFAVNGERLMVNGSVGSATVEGSREVVTRILFLCGVAASVLYFAANVIVPTQWAEYSFVDQTVSELSAIGAPTRGLWIALMVPYGILLIAFGAGVWMCGERMKRLRLVGAMLIAQGVVGYFWPPMHLRGAETTLTDTMHIVFTLIVVPLMMLGIGFSAPVVGKWYAVGTLSIVILFGAMAGFYGPNVAANLPTPWVGIWERISIGAWTIWVVVLAVRLMRADTFFERGSGGSGGSGRI